VWLYVYVRAKRKKGESILPEAPARPADELALEALRALESERLWQRGKIKEVSFAVDGYPASITLNDASA